MVSSAARLKSFLTRSFTGSHWISLALALFFGVLTIQYVKKIQSPTSRSAFMRWCGQIEELWHDRDIWRHHAYPNPPIMALVLSPLVVLPDRAGALLWFALKIAMALCAIRWTIRILERHGEPFPLWGKLAGLALVLRPIEGDLVHGNVNIFILFLLAASCAAFFRRRDVSAGLILGLAVACKLTPLLFVPYFAWKRAWRTLAGCALGLALFVVLVPGLAFGFERNARYLESWFEQMVGPFVVDGQVTSEHQNQSLPGLAYRLLTDSASFSDRVGHDYFPREYHNFLSLDSHTVRWLIKILMVLFALLVVASCRTPLDCRDWRLLAEFSLIALGMLLFSERTWKHHCVTLLFPLAVLGFRMSSPAAERRQRPLLCAALAAAAVLITSTGTGLHDSLDRFGKLAQVYGAYVWAFLVLAAAMTFVLRPGRRPERTPISVPRFVSFTYRHPI